MLSAFICLMPCSAVSTDGTHLQRALRYVEEQAAAGSGSVISGRADLRKVVVGGRVVHSANHGGQGESLVPPCTRRVSTGTPVHYVTFATVRR